MTEEAAPLGHNNPPSPIDLLIEEMGGIAKMVEAIPAFPQEVYAELRALLSRISEDSAAWIAHGKIEDAQTASVAADHIAQLRAFKKKAESARKEWKAVWTAKGDEAYSKFNLLISSADKGIEKMLAMQTAFLREEQERKDEAARIERERLAAEREKIEQEAARAAAAGDIMGAAEAEAARAEQEKAAAAAERAARERVKVGSASGAGGAISQRKQKVATVTNYMAALLHFKDHPKMIELVQTLANARAREADFDITKDTIPGCEVREVISAA